MPSYSKSFKESVVKKITSPNGPNALTLSKEINVPYVTIRRWIRNFGNIHMSENQLKAKDRKPTEKLALLSEYLSLDEVEKGAFLRKKGLTDAHFVLWNKEFINAISPETIKSEKDEVKALKKELQIKEKDLNRKNKALAETTALLVLKKKVDLLFGEVEE